MMLDKLNNEEIERLKKEHAGMPYLETEKEAAEGIADFYYKKKEIASDNKDDDNDDENDDKNDDKNDDDKNDDNDDEYDDDENDDNDMIKNARFLLKDVENNKFDKIKIKEKCISKHYNFILLMEI